MIAYWKPEPRKPSRDLMYHCLLWPAVLYSIGVIIYSAMALVPNGAIVLHHKIGSVLMVVGGELGTLPTAIEVFRKRRADEGTRSDTGALVVSLMATLGNLFVVYTSFSSLAVWWVTFVRRYGPLTLLLFSGLDFYANALELGHYKASFAERWEKWNDSRHAHEQRERTRAQNAAQPATEAKQPEAPAAHICEWCGAQFAKAQGVSAHLRFCEAYKEHKAQEDRTVHLARARKAQEQPGQNPAQEAV